MTSREKSSILSRLHEKRNDISILCISILSVCHPQLLSGSAFTSNIILGVLAEWGNNQREAKKIKQTHDFSFGSSLSLEPWNTWVSLNKNGKPDTQIRKRETESSRLLSSFLSFRTWNEWFINEWMIQWEHTDVPLGPRGPVAPWGPGGPRGPGKPGAPAIPGAPYRGRKSRREIDILEKLTIHLSGLKYITADLTEFSLAQCI